jgi:tetratricopeptide (TPR) repeat protein
MDEVRAALQETDKVLAKEIQADEHGIVYAAMAGFNTRAIIDEDDKVNFFEYVAAALDPANVKGFHKDATHPSPKQRAVTVKARLKQVVEKTDLYDQGLLFYQSGDYEKSASFFAEFLRFFPSREVYHNLATCHHQLALRHYRKWKKDDGHIPFMLSLAIDPETRAGLIDRRASGSAGMLYRRHIEKAIKYYQTAIAQDPAYHLAYNNLGCALVIKGEAYKAVGMFKDAHRLAPREPQTLNNLGVAYYLAENLAKAKEYLNAAIRTDPSFGAPLFNLGKIAHAAENKGEARQHWNAYLKIDPHSPWADAIRTALSLQKSDPPRYAKPGSNAAMGLEIGAYEDEVPADWGRPVRTRNYHLMEDPYKVNMYANGIMTISQDDEIIIITTRPDCEGASGQGISAGDSEDKVVAVCGPPQEEVTLSTGKGWIYPSLGMAFVLQDNKVRSWTLFHPNG